jgi:hypothetical protein
MTRKSSGVLMLSQRRRGTLARMIRTTLALAVALACVAASTASAAAPTKLTNRIVTVKVSGSMQTDWTAVPVPDPGCENKPTGSQGSGNETIEWGNAKAIKAQLTGSGKYWGLMFFDRDNKPTSRVPMSGSVKRQGGGVDVVCGKTLEDRSQPCVGSRAFSTNGQFTLAPNHHFQASDTDLTMTTSLYPDCNWIWDSMVVRTGAVLINFGDGKFDPRRLANGRSSVSLKSHDEKKCENEGAQPGIKCTTVTDWRVTLYPAGKKKRRP